MRYGYRPPNSAAILKAIRDGKASNLHELADYFVPVNGKDPEMERAAFCSIYIEVVRKLVKAGLLELEKEPYGKLTVTGNLGLVLTVLNLSLTKLSMSSSDAMVVCPIFGPPGEHQTDLFVLMPFTDFLRPVYEDHICTVAKRHHLSISRADDVFTTEAIVEGIWKAICGCKIVIADCTGRNPNVFYEIGIAHTIGRPTILITQNIDDVPFDLRHLRCIRYDFTPRGMGAFENNLHKTIDTELEGIVIR